ncbi:hypothetical protein BDB01DRAFT_897375 [Pilobolus umbonatus]|nr:hypothetical protein BDB01DRAFT_897375 [Pilobolus umbonatus]
MVSETTTDHCKMSNYQDNRNWVHDTAIFDWFFLYTSGQHLSWSLLVLRRLESDRIQHPLKEWQNEKSSFAVVDREVWCWLKWQPASSETLSIVQPELKTFQETFDIFDISNCEGINVYKALVVVTETIDKGTSLYVRNIKYCSYLYVEYNVHILMGGLVYPYWKKVYHNTSKHYETSTFSLLFHSLK